MDRLDQQNGILTVEPHSRTVLRPSCPHSSNGNHRTGLVVLEYDGQRHAVWVGCVLCGTLIHAGAVSLPADWELDT